MPCGCTTDYYYCSNPMVCDVLLQPATIGGFISRFLQFFEGPLVDGLTSEATAPMLQTKSAALISKFTMETFVKVCVA